MNDVTLPPLVSQFGIPLVNDVQHWRTGTEVEWHVLSHERGRVAFDREFFKPSLFDRVESYDRSLVGPLQNFGV